MRTQKIRDFRETGIYQHVKAVEPDNNMPIEKFALYVLYKYIKSNDNTYFTVRDAHVLPCNDGCIDIPLGTNAKYDGIYDIWLRNCCGVTSISVCFGTLEIPIPEFKLRNDLSIQIPLAFLTEGNEVDHIFSNSTSHIMTRFYTSFIPSIALVNNKLTIKVNKEATCDAHISTVYFRNNSYRTCLAHCQDTFYIDGKQYVAYGGNVSIATEKTSNQGCVIC